MNSDQLRQFRIIAECRNITKAAEKLYITQPALSIALSKLEDEVACQLFLREGRNLIITPAGKKLLTYAQVVTDTIEEAVQYFKVKNCGQLIRLYRIGGISGPILLEGCYSFGDIRLSSTLVRNDELPRIIATRSADIVIADDRCIHAGDFQHMEQRFLYHQQLLLCLPREHPLAQKAEVTVQELEPLLMMGRTNPMGFNSWLSEIKKENSSEFHEEIGVDNVAYLSERSQLSLPYLMGNFGICGDRDRDYFASRKLLPVRGNYTQRDIYLWYDKSNYHKLEEFVGRIIENVRRIREQDERFSI